MLELHVPPLLLVVIVAAAMFGVAVAWPSATLAIPAFAGFAVRLPIALALAALGGLVALAGAWAFRRHRTTVNPMTPERASALVTTGVYRHTRNPMYVGFVLLLAGWCVYLAHAGAALLLPAFAVYLNRYQIAPEERALAAKFGAEFERYAARVRRWL